MEILIEMGKVEELLNNTSVDNVLQLTNELNQFTQDLLRKFNPQKIKDM